MSELTVPLPVMGVAGLLRLAIAWTLAPVSIAASFWPEQSAATLIASFTAVIVLAVTAARRRDEQRRNSHPSPVVAWGPLIVAAPSIAGYVIASVTGDLVATIVGAALATVAFIWLGRRCLQTPTTVAS